MSDKIETDETIEIIIPNIELENLDEDTTITKYLFLEACKKANKLGTEHRKIIYIEYEKDSDGWIIRFFCDVDYLW